MILVLLSTIVAQGQIRIGGNVYGGGNHAEVKGSTKVTVKAGDIGAVMDPNATRPLSDPQGKVYGGARMANVGGNTFVHIDGEHATDYILINQVFGGNDISGKIGTAMTVGEDVPTELTAIKSAMPPSLPEGKTEEHYNDVGKTFNSYVRISTLATSDHYTQKEIDDASTDPEDPAYGKRTTDVKPDPAAKKIYIGQLFSGGNGDYTYLDDNGGPLRDGDDYIAKQGSIIIARSATPFVHPEQDSTYLEVLGGSIVYAYGGGNNATVKEQTIIHIDNPSAVVNHILVTDGTGAVDAGIEADAATYTDYVASVAAGTPVIPSGYEELLTTERFKEMGINTSFSFPSSGAFQVGRFFGGNNKAEMHIRPTWNLLAGKVRNLYSGGNKGKMTSEDGLLLEIKDYSTLIVDNLYGGCRMADVMPTVNGVYKPCSNLEGYYFPNQLSARVLVKGGHINNVYGGNDVTGVVYGGNAVGIYTTVYGDVYGGGNGAYPYTDSESLKDDATYGDFYFDTEGFSSTLDALNAFRPNAEQVSLRLAGTNAANKTIIKGSVFVGGNCASLATKKGNPTVELKIGSHVWADKVFLGNNGEKMIDPQLLNLYKTNSSIILTDKSVFADYMNGVAMPLKPAVVFDSETKGDPATYEDYTSMIGSFYGGGNKGSMIISGKTTLKFDRKLIIFDKLVGGCNDADVEETELNAAYEGGLLGAADERGDNPGEYYTDTGTATGKINDRLELNLDNLLIEPKRWTDRFTPITSGTLTAGKEYYETDLPSTKFIATGEEPAATEENPYYELATVGLDLEWNTAKWSTDEDDFVSTGTENSEDDEYRRLMGGNVYGGCYSSGHVNGNVVININQDLIKRDVVFAEANSEDPYTISGARRSGVLKESQGDDVMAVAMTVFGAGCGKDTEIWGSTTVNHKNGYTFQIFGGGEEGVVGKKNDEGNYVYNAAYSSTVNLNGINAGYSEDVTDGLPIPEAEYLYGGGHEGDVLGDSYLYLGNGRVYDAFGGASNADIYGGTEVHIGYNGGFPWVKDNVYGGNDFGGTVRGTKNQFSVTTRTVFDNELKRSSTYVKYIQGRVDSIFGGCYGSYPYADPIFKDYTYSSDEVSYPEGKSAGAPRDGFSFPHLNDNSFVHFVPADNSNNHVNFIFGGSEGFPGHRKLNNSMQAEAYVLIDDTQTKDANRFANVDVYGGGAFAGVGGTESTLGAGRTAVDLFSGSFHNVYGGCNQEGLVGYTRVNVPAESKAKVNALFGGGKGYDPALFVGDKVELVGHLCDHYVTCIDFKSKDVIVEDAIYGGNENCRIACDTYINIEAPVVKSDGLQATIYGAGYGKKTVSGRTNVFMNNGSNAYKVFGGGRDGNAFNYATLISWLTKQFRDAAGDPEADVRAQVAAYGTILNNFGTYLESNPIKLPTTVGTYVNAEGAYDGTYTNDIMTNPKYHQTNVHIMNGGNVSGYAYGGGYGSDAVVAGSTYVELKGGNVDRDIYGGGQGGPVFDEYGLATDGDDDNDFVATTNVYIEGGMARNVYGGGYLGHVGKHCKEVDGKIVEAAINEMNVIDIPAVANVIIGKTDGASFYNGIPAIQRNVYGGGEGGSVYGTTNLTINNGYVGYRYKNTATSGAPVYEYVEELDDQTPNAIELAGNAFGGGYVVNSYVDNANVTMYGGTLRGNLYGGGEVGPIGRGTVRYKDTYDTGLVNGNARIFKAGQTHVKMFNGHVMRNVFGGGRGKDSWGGDGTMYMDKKLVPSLDLQVKGFVFGQTDVNIYGGEIGSNEGLASGFGNVFGGGDEGYVYSAYEQNGNLYIGKKSGERYDKGEEGYYYKSNGTNFVDNDGSPLDGGEKFLTEDCHVLVEPWLQLKSPVTYNEHDYKVGDYIPTSYLNTLPKKDKNAASWPAAWDDVDAGSTVDGEYVERGVIIHNAVFAGGNIAVGSELYANTKTVFGNATASIHDVYNRDLITVGGIHIGGLYGDGNLTFVDGYRELNVTNYGTDYYNIKEEINNEVYKNLPPREQAYYELKYKCLQQCIDKENTTYTPGTNVPLDELLVLFEGAESYNGGVKIVGDDGKPNPAYWTENGVVSRYAGRYLNTLQRADFCGVFGSRLVMKGAKDRVPEVEDATNYTINRVREVSLNKKASTAGDVGEFATHGNYFGIYSVVNFLGALTSDLNFYNAVRTTDNKDHAKYVDPEANGKPYGTATYADWKEQYHKDPRRNNGLSHNEVALASGVHLELTTEESTGITLDTKEWGIITGVVQLDLINVAKGVGGGFVYAKNIHGVRGSSGKNQMILTDLNLHGGVGDTPAVTNRIWEYIETDTDGTASSTQKEWQTSGNFVHNTQTIIDDCYNITNRYQMGNRVPAHYWYIRGTVYVYDQYITAQTGSATAYSKNVELPITISAAAHNQMKLLDVQPNLYAYYSSYSSGSGIKLGDDKKLLIQNNEYYLNSPISYWDWYLLPASERNLFVDETYVTSDKCKIGETIYPAGMVMLPSEYGDYEGLATTQVIDGKSVKAVLKIVQDEEGNDVVAKDSEGHDIYVPFTSVFHSSNEMGHGTGYLLTYKMTNPKLWDTWYTEAANTNHDKSQTEASGWENGPTYYLNSAEGKLLGQHEYKKTDIIPQSVYTCYNSINTAYIPNYGKSEGDAGYDASKKQAIFEEAYVVTAECSDANRHYYKGAAVSKTVGTSAGVSASPAYVCTGTIKLSSTEYIFVNDLMTYSEKETLKTNYPSAATDIEELVVPAYYCTSAGLYGGNYYEAGKNYRALEAWSAMSESDRDNFTFNYDAFDLLIDPTYGQAEGRKYQYDSASGTLVGAKANPAQYSLETPIDYTATYDGTSLDAGKTVHVKHADGAEADVTNIVTGDMLERDVYESLLNEQYHYAPIEVDVSKATNYYVVNESFYYKEPFAAGQVIDAETYNSLPNSTEEGGLNYQNNVDVLTFSETGTYYYCRDSYTIEKGTSGGKPVKAMIANGDAIAVNTVIAPESTVPVGFVISQNGDDPSFTNGYKSLTNKQLGFTISGVSPMETSTLYVSRDANFDDLSKEKIITVVYQYDYEESDESGTHITPISERHVVRIHVTFEDGIPTVEDIREPDIVLPGNSITMRVPGVNSNGYEVIGGGWELFETKEDAESHFSGKEYTPSSEPLYWYQDEFYIAYYAKTFNRGKTYSNTVPIHVANYHDLKEVMDDKVYHLHVDYDRTQLKRDSKIYINDYSESSENGLDLFKDFYDLSIGTHLDGHSELNISTAVGTNKYDGKTYQRGVMGGTNLDFFLRADISRDDDPEVANEWTPIASGDNPCFNGTLHGDGHTLSGLDNSLFHKLCGSVYNLGVMGSFNTAGIVDVGDGYVESCWTKTSATTALGEKPNAVFGNPTDGTGYQVVNSYFYEGNKDLYANVSTDATTGITTSGGARGKATAKSAKAYYNGELAYDLNNFYLYKRYCDHEVETSTDEDNPQRYSYLAVGEGGVLELQNNHCYAPHHADLCSTGHEYETNKVIMYVEDRFADGDFRYAAGEIPTSEDERFYSWKENEGTNQETVRSSFFPIWPDDYIFFGQKLTYGWAVAAHQEVPTAVTRNNGRLSQLSDANRVYRAPAYFRSKEMGVAHFNPDAYLAQKSNDGTKTAYPGMTAIDFAGHYDTDYILGQAYRNGQNWKSEKNDKQQAFYPPLLDDDGLLSIINCDETRNLLTYAPAESAATGYANKATYDVLTAYFTDPAYNDYYHETVDGKKYRTVEDATSVNSSIYGHLVKSNLKATNDHLLVDKEDFNCPIGYDFDSSHRMWYQRKPEDHEYVDFTKGWQGISIPFTAELVTTNQKGEITHFYSGSETSKNGTGSMIGHEYWLREFKSIIEEGEPKVAKASFLYPDAIIGVDSKMVENTFLWDYYYKNTVIHNQKDKNDDTYQTYYEKSRTYSGYPLLAAAVPYIIGFPGPTYYEFDLSGNFEAQNTAVSIPKLYEQIISFVSDAGISIGVSDVETKGKKITYNSSDYTFKPSYMNENLEAGTNSYTLDTEGDSYDKVPATGVATKVSAFRPYFTATATASSSRRMLPGSILFGGDFNGLEGEPISTLDGGLEIYVKDHKIITTSHLKEATTIRIINVSGITLANYVLQPGETRETRVQNTGVYIVNKKKLLVK